MMTFTMKAGLCALMMLCTGAVAAKDYSPPMHGSVGAAKIAASLGKVGILDRRVVRIGANIERDGNLYYGFFGDVL